MQETPELTPEVSGAPRRPGEGVGGGDRGRGPGPVTRGHAVRGATPRRAPPLAAALWRPLAAASGAGAERGNTAAGAALVLTPPARPLASPGHGKGPGRFPAPRR